MVDSETSDLASTFDTDGWHEALSNQNYLMRLPRWIFETIEWSGEKFNKIIHSFIQLCTTDGTKVRLTAKDKAAVWSQIEKEMSGYGTIHRSAQELRRKKENWFSEVKAKVRTKTRVK